MKHTYLMPLLVFILLFSAIASRAQQNNDLLNVLVKKNLISQQEADTLKAEAAAKEKANQHGVYIGSRALQLSGLVQTEYEGFQQKGVNNTFLLHRARLDVKGVIDDHWSYEVYTEFAGVNPKLLDAYATYRIEDYIRFTAGQYKVPFSIESLFNDSELEFIDRSQVVNALAGRSTDVIGNQNGRDVGIDANGSFAKIDNRYLFDYALGVFNGNGYDQTTANINHKDVAGRFTIHPIANLGISADFINGQALYILTGAKAATINKRNRKGIDGRYVIGGLSLQAEYDKGTDGTIKRDGWYGQASYFVLPKKLQFGVKYDTYDPNLITLNARTNDYTGAISYYFNNWAKFTLNYVDRREQGTQIPNNIFEAQLQLTF